MVHVAGDDLQRQLEFYKIPFATISQYCVDNGITPLVTTLLHTDVDEVKVNKNGIAIKYYATSQFKRAKTVKIPFTQIRTIDLLSPHPISTENRYYQITTWGDTFSFPKHTVDEDKLKQCAEGFGIEVGSRKFGE
ncbi:hypothetical protein CJD36_004900 [Flavipsychrobacter stenotrophus]|uniref:Uncharacterized protein n=1 Tax=Flavipsychrobacter stenotrophus TaxID=2077091 RepID=A0A2S7T2R1_9BACT|nr:hypothetical protein [Flavipsychrobacter stenotrophus]PQJ13085.1 hypothetical protein CJD36_004900 [Flavipsychrobacter stenotrophus]